MMINKHGTQKIQSLMYMLLVLRGTSYDLKLKVNVAHAIWPGLLVSTIFTFQFKEFNDCFK